MSSRQIVAAIRTSRSYSDRRGMVGWMWAPCAYIGRCGGILSPPKAFESDLDVESDSETFSVSSNLEATPTPPESSKAIVDGKRAREDLQPTFGPDLWDRGCSATCSNRKRSRGRKRTEVESDLRHLGDSKATRGGSRERSTCAAREFACSGGSPLRSDALCSSIFAYQEPNLGRLQAGLGRGK